MKKIIALVLALSLLLCGCGRETVPETTAAPTTEATTVPTTEAPTEPPTTEPPTYVHPLNGSILTEPFTDRIYANTISNVREAWPHVSLNEADVVVEMFVNGSVVRCVALYSDVSDVPAIGSTRSTRPMINDIVEHYDAVLAHAGGTGTALKDADARGIYHYNVDSLMRKTDDPLKAGTAYRDRQYKSGEHNLFAIGAGVLAYAESQGVQVKGLPERDYGFVFTEDGTPEGGEAADTVTIRLKYQSTKKDTVMEYDAETGRYTYWQHGTMMKDQITKEPETFRNVVVMFSPMSTIKHGYHVTEFTDGGEGWFACGGKIIPMKWTCDGDKEPFRFFTLEGQPLAFGAGNTYIAVTDPAGDVTWTADAQ